MGEAVCVCVCARAGHKLRFTEQEEFGGKYKLEGREQMIIGVGV